MGTARGIIEAAPRCNERHNSDSLLISWQMALLRFAVTLEAADRLLVLHAAHDADGAHRASNSNASFAFFRRISVSLCDAIQNANDARDMDILWQHLGRVADLRLKRALAGALGLTTEDRAKYGAERKRKNLWAGLRR